MKRKIIYVAIGILFLISLMFAEYRFIMHNIKLYSKEENIVYAEFFGQIDEYYIEN